MNRKSTKPKSYLVLKFKSRSFIIVCQSLGKPNLNRSMTKMGKSTKIKLHDTISANRSVAEHIDRIQIALVSRMVQS